MPDDLLRATAPAQDADGSRSSPESRCHAESRGVIACLTRCCGFREITSVVPSAKTFITFENGRHAEQVDCWPAIKQSVQEPRLDVKEQNQAAAKNQGTCLMELNGETIGLSEIGGKRILLELSIEAGTERQWCQDNALNIDRHLYNHGALLIRGLKLRGSKRLACFIHDRSGRTGFFS